MGKIKLLIADSDDSYIEAINRFFTGKYYYAFDLKVFSDKKQLKEYLTIEKSKIDILVADPIFLNQIINLSNIEVVCILSSGIIPADFKKYNSINKFLIGEKLVERIQEIYSEQTKKIFIHQGSKNSKVISILSPMGGTGKTTISFAVAKELSKNNLNTFYLNLDENSIINYFFDNQNKVGLTQVFYHIKAKTINLSNRLQTFISKDEHYGIDFFMPSKNFLETDEITSEEYIELISEMREISKYDYILVDLPTMFSEKSVAVLRDSNIAIVVISKDIISKFKTTSFINQLSLLEKKYNIDILNKLIIVVNKTNHFSLNDITDYKLESFKDILTVDFIKDLYDEEDGKLIINKKENFDRQITELFRKVVEVN
jgi:cellulose biosynthesis protein BcsQ